MPSVGGAERIADQVMMGLHERGHHVAVLAEAPRGVDPASLRVDRPYPVDRYRRLPTQHLWPELLAAPLGRFCRRHRVELILAWYAYPTGYAAAFRRRWTGLPVVVSPRGADLYPHFHALRKPRVAGVIRAGYRAADRIVCNSRWAMDRLASWVGPPLPPIDLVRNGIDLDAFDRSLTQARQAPALANHPLAPTPFLLHLARVAPVKHQCWAMAGIALAARDLREAGLRYVFVGDGADLAPLRARVSELGLDDVVMTLGARHGVEKAWLLGHASAMVTTSREESMPNVMLEALAAGLPVLASDIDPHRELIEGRHWGRLFPQNNETAFAQALTALARDVTADPTAMRQAALAERANYALSVMIDGFEHACQQALAARQKR